MPEDTRIRLSYGDLHYEVRFLEGELREHAKMRIVSYMYKALSDFHKDHNTRSTLSAETRSFLYELAADRPDLIPDLRERGLI
jgi:hypothetical protein